jgi:hypothetical protein
VGVRVVALFGSRAGGEVGVRADRRMRVQRLQLLLLGQFPRDAASLGERPVELCKAPDESGVAFEQLGELSAV